LTVPSRPGRFTFARRPLGCRRPCRLGRGLLLAGDGGELVELVELVGGHGLRSGSGRRVGAVAAASVVGAALASGDHPAGVATAHDPTPTPAPAAAAAWSVAQANRQAVPQNRPPASVEDHPAARLAASSGSAT
jgi:hypothetical protein